MLIGVALLASASLWPRSPTSAPSLAGLAEEKTAPGVSFEGLTFSTGGEKGKTILHGCSGEAAAGRMLAIMGPSGSGKTTLLNALAGQLKAGPKATLTGRLTVGGDLCGGAGEVSGLRVAYVRQEDVFYTQMTVRETLLFAARLRLPASTSLAEKERRVEEIISRRLLLPCRAPLRLFTPIASCTSPLPPPGSTSDAPQTPSSATASGAASLAAAVPLSGTRPETVRDMSAGAASLAASGSGSPSGASCSRILGRSYTMRPPRTPRRLDTVRAVSRLLFLDEPTSGLDAFAAQQVASRFSPLGDPLAPLGETALRLRLRWSRRSGGSPPKAPPSS